MVHYHRIVRCPHCNALTGYTNSTSKQLVGNPKRICTKCHQAYYDFAYLEDAIAYYNRQLPTPLHSLIYTVVWVVLSALFIFAFFTGKGSTLSRTVFGVIALFPITLTVLCFRATLLDYKKTRDKESFLRNLHAEMERKAVDADARNRELSESMKRLSNPDYLDLLADNGIEIPDFFIDRLNYRDSFEKNRENRKSQLQSDLDKLKKEQQKWRMAQHFLAMGKTNKNFQAAAKELGMTPDEYSTYCRNIIQNYDELHRQYNATHSIPADYPTTYDPL